MERRRNYWVASIATLLVMWSLTNPVNAQTTEATCNRIVQASVVAMDQVLMYNRLGAVQPAGMIFALERDVMPIAGSQLSEGNVQLKPYKRPRPIVLRVNQGDCLEVKFTNLLNQQRLGLPFFLDQENGGEDLTEMSWATGTATRTAGFHILGVNLVNQTAPASAAGSVESRTCEFTDSMDGISNNASFVGGNDNSLANPGETVCYKYYAPEHGAFLLQSQATITGGTGGGQLNAGLFGGLHVEPPQAEYYRSQITKADLECATQTEKGKPIRVESPEPNNPYDVPLINYQAQYVTTGKDACTGSRGIYAEGPILNMLEQPDPYKEIYEIVHSDLTAIITGPDAGRFPFNENSPMFDEVPVTPDRRQPFREFSIFYHSDFNIVEPFPEFYTPGVAGSEQLSLSGMLPSGGEAFAMNYGTAAISTEIFANRIGVGPEGGCTECKYEEFFLSSWAVGDPAMVVDQPANIGVLNSVYNAETSKISMEKTQGVSPPSDPSPAYLEVAELTSADAWCSAPELWSATLYSAANESLQLCTSLPEVYPCGTSNCTEISVSKMSFDAPSCGDNCDPSTDPFRFDNPGPDGVSRDTVVKAKKALFPDDPSNVYHSYMRDHVIFRIHQADSDLHHIHHQHAHQWLHTPNAASSHYLDSQAFGPGSSFTLDMVYNGSGNRNQTVGDSIFHCHFYPHFADGMWSLWRVHDVLEEGTALDSEGIPVPKARALPDGEIAAGTPIPSIVPIPTIPMAPPPAKVWLEPAYPLKNNNGTIEEDKSYIAGYEAKVLPEDVANGINPGFPFFIPGIGGQRAPHPPLDFTINPGYQEGQSNPEDKYLDGGLPRHIVVSGSFTEYQTVWDFSKYLHTINARELPEEGTAVEKLAMATHAQRTHRSYYPEPGPDNEPIPGYFVLNGLPPQQGAPYADPCTLDNGDPAGTDKTYYGANIELDVIFNKAGWHYPQQRIITLWGDAIPTLYGVSGSGQKAPEPFFFRANTNDCIIYHQTNLVPFYYDADNFQIRTPTDILGQHIHLVKFDVTSSDGAANGFNYEDGTFSAQEVQERIAAINKVNGIYALKNAEMPTSGWSQTKLSLQPPPYFCDEATWGNTDWFAENCRNPDPMLEDDWNPQFSTVEEGGQTVEVGKWVGAQTTVQRWFADPQLNDMGKDRTLRSVFTHDHFSPSTHQQAGLYASLLVEPENSVWKDPLTGDVMGNRQITVNNVQVKDGGPTSWQAIIETSPEQESYREFGFMMQDLALSYSATSKAELGPRPESKLAASTDPSNPPAGTNYSWFEAANTVQTVNLPFHSTQIISQEFFSGTYTVNYRNEPLQLRLSNPDYYTYDPSGGMDNLSIAVTSFYNANFASKPTYQAESCNTTPAYGTSTGESPNAVTAASDPYCFTSEEEAAQAGDVAFMFNSIPRANRLLNKQPMFPDPLNQYTTPVKNDPRHYPRSLYCPFDAEDCSEYNEVVEGTDPFTPVMRAYANDKVQVRVVVGAHLATHFFNIQGLKWFAEPVYTNSGYRNSQVMGISEHFEFLFDLPPNENDADYLYFANAGSEGVSQGIWGLLRAYAPQNGEQFALEPLPNNPLDSPVNSNVTAVSCPDGSPTRSYEVVVTSAAQALGAHDGNGTWTDYGTLTYYNRNGKFEEGLVPSGTSNNLPINETEKIVNPFALLYLDRSLVDQYGTLRDSKQPIEPLVLRANAGDCIQVHLTNLLDKAPDIQKLVENFKRPATNVTYLFSGQLALNNNVELYQTTQVGLHPQLVSYDMNQSNGFNAGKNPKQTVGPGESISYQWYAGNVEYDSEGQAQGEPVEFGTINLLASDPLYQHQLSMIGALIVEPKGASWKVPNLNTTSANITYPNPEQPGQMQTFREMVTILQDELMQFVPINAKASGCPETIDDSLPVDSQCYNDADTINNVVNTITGSGDPMGGDYGTVNMGTDPQVFRMALAHHLQDAPGGKGFRDANDYDLSCLFSDRFSPATSNDSIVYEFATASQPAQLSGSKDLYEQGVKTLGKIQTPLFTAAAGDQVRIRLMHPHGLAFSGQIYTMDGHPWQEYPYQENSQVIAFNPQSQWFGARMGTGPTTRYDIVLENAGGPFQVTGDYMYRTMQSIGLRSGMWGLMRVVPAGQDSVTVTAIYRAETEGKYSAIVEGYVTENPTSETLADEVNVYALENGQCTTFLGTQDVDPYTGEWTLNYSLPGASGLPSGVCAQSVTQGQLGGYDHFQLKFFEDNPSCRTSPGSYTINQVFENGAFRGSTSAVTTEPAKPEAN